MPPSGAADPSPVATTPEALQADSKRIAADHKPVASTVADADGMTPSSTLPAVHGAAVHGAALRVASSLQQSTTTAAPTATADDTDTITTDTITTDMITAVHRSVRAAASALSDRTRRLGHYDLADADELRRYWSGFRIAVQTHHEIEDTIIHPAVLGSVPSAAGVIGLATRDHRLLDDLIAGADGALAKLGWGVPAAPAARLMHRIDELIHRHLDLEETQVMPLMARHVGAEERAELASAMVRRLAKGKQARFTVPFIASWLAPSHRSRLLATAPATFRMRHRLSQRSHRRLTTRALRDSRARSFDAHIAPA